jgi:peptide/nickel transport system substrate-binding protein
MPQERGKCRRIRRAITAIAVTTALAAAGSCRGTGGSQPAASSTVLRIGTAQLSATNPNQGLRQLVQNQSVEGLALPGEDGRMQPRLAEGWTPGNDGRSLTIKLRPNAKFHDGSPVDAKAVAGTLPDGLRSFMGPVFSDVEYVRASAGGAVELGFRRASPFLLEALETQIQKPGEAGVGTGAFVAPPNSTTDMRANADYYLGRPVVDTIHVESYPSVRTAWAEMLRGRIDFLYEVGADALDSMEKSTTVSVFTFTRRYQFVIVLNQESPVMRSPEIRRALNQGIDRGAVVRNALNSYGVPSSGPVWLRYWALPPDLPKFEFDPKAAADAVDRATHTAAGRAASLHFTCLVPPDTVNERVALEVKRQLGMVGIDMAVEQISGDQIVQRTTKKEYDAALIELISGPTLFRPYLIWHSNTPLNWAGWGNPTVDSALDGVREAPTEDTYRRAVTGLQQAFMDDPPAIFLAWQVRARAISNRFVVPPPEAGRDVIGTLRVWKPAAGSAQASRN